MYIKLTRLDNSPIWINAAFVVTVELRRGGGSIVVPIGDGFDYDVRETPEQVLAMIEGTPAPTVVPVPPVETASQPVQASEPPEPQKEVKKSRKSSASKKSGKSRKPAMPLSEIQVSRLRKLAPKSLAKLQNTLSTQFNVTDVSAAVEALAANEVFSLDDKRVTWPEVQQQG